MTLSRRDAIRRIGGTGLAVVTGSVLALSLESPALAAQSNWRWCHLCEGLWFNGHTFKGACAGNGGGSHHSDGSGNYSLLFAADAGTGQTNWRYCHLCEGLWFNGHMFKGACPGNGNLSHHSDGSGDYKIESASVGGGQSNWRYCHLCEGMWFNGHAFKGACPGNGGGSHQSDESGNYQLRQV
ncbi:hypothetical protein [Phytohabitans aurantiacus]|nr:hypothetical protein [Phytohabitans aurantiacus]